MKRTYTIPNFLAANGTISLTTSQAAEIGTGMIAKWDEFWADAEDFVNEGHPNFDVNDSSTWYNGFDWNDPTTWNNLLDWAEEE